MAQAVDPELPSPFITSQKDIQRSSALRSHQYEYNDSHQAAAFAPQPVDSPLEFETVLQQPNGGTPVKRWGFASQLWASRSFIGRSSVVDRQPCPVRVMPLSSGWYDSGSFTHVTAQTAQDQLPQKDQQQARISQQPAQRGRNVQVHDWPVDPVKDQELSYSRNASHKHGSKLRKLLSSLHNNALNSTHSRKHCGSARPCTKRSHSSRRMAQNHCAFPGHGADTQVAKPDQQQWAAGSPAETSSAAVTPDYNAVEGPINWWSHEPQQHLTPVTSGSAGDVVGSWPHRKSRSRSPSPSRRDSNSHAATAVAQSRCSVLLEEQPSVGDLSENFSDSLCLSLQHSAAVAVADAAVAAPQPGAPATTRSISFDGAGQGAAKQRRSRHHHHCRRSRSAIATASFRGRSPLDNAGSLRTALAALDHASAHAGRFFDKLSQGLARVTSFAGMPGVLRHPVGKEVYRDWELGPELGRGASCVTRLAFARHNGCTAACKTIHKSGIFRSAAVKSAVLGVQRELAIMQHTSGHPNVVQLKGVYEDSKSLHLLLEWCGGGSLTQLADKAPGGRCGEGAAAAVAKAVLEVLAVCHSKGVIHRDIKLDNLLLSRPVDDPQRVTADMIKVTDFGISVPFMNGQVHTELAGTLEYMSPEVLQRRYCQQADIWSTGVVLYELISGRLPYAADTLEQMLHSIQKTELDFCGPGWDSVSGDAKSIVALMLTQDPANRPDAQQLLCTFHDWLQLGVAQ